MTTIRDLTDLFYLFPNEPTKGDEPNDQTTTNDNPCVHRNA